MNRLIITLIAALLCCSPAIAADKPGSTFEQERKELIDHCRQSRDCKVVYIGRSMLNALGNELNSPAYQIKGLNLSGDVLKNLTSVEMIQALKPGINDYIINSVLTIFSEKNGYEIVTYNDDPQKGSFSATMHKRLGAIKFETVLLSRPKKKAGVTLCIITSSVNLPQLANNNILLFYEN